MADYIRGLWERREFVWFLAVGNLRARNASTTLGLVWYVLNPLLLAGVYFFVFGVLFAGSRRGDPEFLAYLVAGMFVFRFTSTTMTGGASTISKNASLMVNLRFPRLLLPISSLLESAIGFIVSLVTFFALIAPIAGTWPTLTIWAFVPIFVLQLALNLGLGCLTARWTLPHPDLHNLLPYVTRLWLYLSPIIWAVDDPRFLNAPEWAKTAVEINPLYHFLNVYRGALMGSSFSFTSTDLVLSAAWALGILVVGIYTFVRFEGNMVQHL
ncbi:MAG: ABC transporter permease [Actinomycetota bacterium]